MPKPGIPSNQADLDAVARARGYRNYAHLLFVAKNRLPRPKEDGGGLKTNTTRAGNFFQELFNDPKKALESAFSFHPSVTIGKAGAALREANQRGQ